MTDAINNFVAWYQGLPQAAQIGIPVAGAAGVFVIAKHKGGLQGSQVFGPDNGSSQGGSGMVPPPVIGPGLPVTPPGPPPPGAPPPQPNPKPKPKPTGGGSNTGPGGGTFSPPTSPMPGSSPDRRPLPAVKPIGLAPASGSIASGFGRPLPGASHPIYTGQGNAYIVNGQDIARSQSGAPNVIRPNTQIGPTAAEQKAHASPSGGTAPAPLSQNRQQQRRGFAYTPPTSPYSSSATAANANVAKGMQAAAAADAYRQLAYQRTPRTPPPTVYHQKAVAPVRPKAQAPPSAVQRGGRLVY